VHESAAVKLTSYPGTFRQLIITGLGRDAPTVIITNDDDITTRALIGQYARRLTIEQRLAEIIQAFCADALSSTVNLNVDLDIMLCVLAQARPRPCSPRSAPALAPATPTPPPTPSSAASSTPQGPSSPAPTSSPSASTGALTHPSCARPASPPTPPSPGGTTASSTSNSPDQGSNPLRGNRR
jgi:hypothetical protein